MATIYDTKGAVQGEPIFGSGQLLAVKAKTFFYDYTKMGGAAGGYILGKLPANAVILDISAYWTDVSAGGSAYKLGSAEGGAQFIADMGAAAAADTLIHGTAIMDTSSRLALAVDTDVILTITGTGSAGHLVATFIYFTTDIA